MIGRLRTAGALAIAAGLLTGCSSGSDDPEGTSDGSGIDRGDDHAAGQLAEGLDELFSDALHEGVEPAASGTAYIEVEGQRYVFTDVACEVHDDPDAGRFNVVAYEEAGGIGHQLYFKRTIGDDVGWNWEDEYVQLAVQILEGGEDAMNQYHSSLAQHEREQGAAPEWELGDGTSPLVRVVGKQATATGVLEALMLHDEAVEGEFIAAVTCP